MHVKMAPKSEVVLKAPSCRLLGFTILPGIAEEYSQSYLRHDEFIGGKEKVYIVCKQHSLQYTGACYEKHLQWMSLQTQTVLHKLPASAGMPLFWFQNIHWENNNSIQYK